MQQRTKPTACSDCESLSRVPASCILSPPLLVFPSVASLPLCLRPAEGPPSLWAGGARLVTVGRWLAPVRSVASNVPFTLTWADPVTCTARRRIACGRAVDSQGRRRTARVLEESLKAGELFCWRVSHACSSLYCVTIPAACVKIQQCGCVSAGKITQMPWEWEELAEWLE